MKEKKKIAVITRHAITNYGSLLQAIATQQAVQDIGHECKIIDYIRKDESYLQYEKTMLARKPEWNNSPIKKALYLSLRQPESILSGRRFERERRKYLLLTKRYATPEELLKEVPDADIFMTGSDQVWGPVASGSYDSSYCLSFSADAAKRISYAASFGHTDMTPELESYYKKWLNRYNHIAVREESAVSILKGWEIDAFQVLDPTLLYDEAYWSRFITWRPKGKYVLIYQIHNNPRVGAYAKKVAAAKGLKLIRVSASFHQINREGTLVWCPNINKFLSYIKNAEVIVTDSFHGTAFAINFNKSFVEVLPNNNTGTRNMSILTLTGLEGRILKNDDDVALADVSIDYGSVNRILNEKRKKSLDILKYMIEQ